MMKKKKIYKLTESKLKNIVHNAIMEHIEELSKIDNRISIYTYDLSNDEDYEDVLSKLPVLWEMILNSYKHIGGVKGIKKEKELITKHNLVRIAYLNNDIIAVAFYSDRLKGNKLAYCGTRGNFGKLGMSTIIGRDSDPEYIEEYNWVECSGGIEKLFRRAGGYNLPNKYVSDILNNTNIKLLPDGFHYERTIGERSNTTFTKTIYGFNSEEAIKMVYNDVFGDLISDIKLAYERLKDNQTLNKDNNKTYHNREEVALIIIDKIDELHSYADINEFPKFIIDELIKNIQHLKTINGRQRSVEYAEEILNNITEFKIIKKNLKNKISKSIAL